MLSGQQQQLRAFASAFGHQRTYLDLRSCAHPSFPSLSSSEWRLAAQLQHKTQAEQWTIQAAAVVSESLPKRLPSQGN